MTNSTLLVAAVGLSGLAAVSIAGYVAIGHPAHAPCCAKAIAAPAIPVQGRESHGFTGEYVDGVPVYRLPPVAVTASRSEELARIALEDQLARAEPDRAGPAASLRTMQIAHTFTPTDPQK